MSARRILTKRFFTLGEIDQVAVVDAALSDLESALGRVKPAARKAIKRAIKRIESKAIQYGIYHAEEASHG